MGLISKLIGGAIAYSACNSAVSKANKQKETQKHAQLETLEHLKYLYDSGAITKKEYERKKKEILSRC